MSCKLSKIQQQLLAERLKADGLKIISILRFLLRSSITNRVWKNEFSRSDPKNACSFLIAKIPVGKNLDLELFTARPTGARESRRHCRFVTDRSICLGHDRRIAGRARKTNRRIQAVGQRSVWRAAETTERVLAVRFGIRRVFGAGRRR